MAEKDRKPRIRFKGFADAWEQRKLGEVGAVAMCKRIFKEQTTEEGDIPFFKIGTFGGEADAFISRELFEEYKSKYPYPSKGAILISASGSIGRTVEFTGKNEYFQDSNIVWLTHDDRLQDSFLKYLYATITWAGIEGSTIKRLYNDNILKTQVMIPSSIEQTKLGTLFSRLDNLITLHQRKYDKLVDVKKSMLEKMFPQGDEKVPKIRFKGFSDAWEQRKVGELSEKTYGGGTPSTQNEGFWNGEIPWIQSSDIEEGRLYGVTPKKFISQDGLNQSAAQLIPKNSIAIITRVGVGKLAFMPFSYATSQDFVSLSRLTVDPFFTVYACYRRLQTDLNSVQGTSIKGITKEELLSKVIFFPDEPEQRLIGGLFRRLDDLITLHQRKLEKLKNIKSALLEKMFV